MDVGEAVNDYEPEIGDLLLHTATGVYWSVTGFGNEDEAFVSAWADIVCVHEPESCPSRRGPCTYYAEWLANTHTNSHTDGALSLVGNAETAE